MKYDITKFYPCGGALEFYSEFKTSKEAWEKCPRGDWMLWIASKLKVDIRLLTLAKAECANTVRHLMKDERSINAIEMAYKFARGEATLGELAAASEAAYSAADIDVASEAASEAAYAAAYAAAYSAAYSATDVDVDVDVDDDDDDDVAAAYASYAASYAAAASEAAVYDDVSKKENQLKTADICRKLLTDEIFKLIKTT